MGVGRVMRIKFTLDSLIREVNDGLKYARVRVEATPIGSITAIIEPPEELELIIPPRSLPVLSTEQIGGDPIFETTLYSLNRWIKEAKEEAKKIDLQCHNLIMHLRQLARGGVK